jgi:hypothetical protein
MKRLVKALLARGGWQIVRATDQEAGALADLSPADRLIVSRVAPYTMTSIERRACLLGAVDHLVKHRIVGDIVECGVWRGGSMMAVAMGLVNRGDTSRHLYLYDTFERMTQPTDKDRSLDGRPAAALLERATPWPEAHLDEVRANLDSTGYPRERFHFIQGKVEDTIPGTIPERIALLRLDTDWYESTRHELHHLFPRLAPHGLLIIDDYGHWQGARQAVDEYFAERKEPVFLHRVDYTARLVVKRDEVRR